jgi:parallel beta-helix repeat protein
MVSDGADGGFLKNFVIGNNRFWGYDTAIIIGSGNAGDFESGHFVEGNKIERCAHDGIVVKCGDVQVHGNTVSGCAGSGISVTGGSYSTIEGNRISDCDIGISVGGLGHTVSGNLISGCKSSAVSAKGGGDGVPAAQNLLVHENRFANCPVAVDQGTAGVVVCDNIDNADPAEFAARANEGDPRQSRGAEDGYLNASMPDDDSDYDDAVDIDINDDDDEDDDERNSMIKYMFNPEG